MPGAGAGAGAGAVSRRQVAGAGAGAECCELSVRALVETRCWVLAVRVVETAGAGAGGERGGAGAGCWLCAWWRQGAGCWVPGAGAGCTYRCSVLVPASDSEVITTAASGSEG